MYSSVRSSKQDNQNFRRQGSLRKVIPLENAQTVLFGKQNDELGKFYQMCRQEYLILAEFKMIETENVQGVYVIPSRENPFMWFGVIYVRSGAFEDGVFRFTIILDEQFPDCEHPKVIFQNTIPHPVIQAESNELHLLKAFPTWNRSENHIWQVLKYIQWMFENFEASIAHSVNQQAVDLWQNNREEYNSKAKELVQYTHEHLYDAPPTEDQHYITFQQYSSEEHDGIKAQMEREGQLEDIPRLGLSWVVPGSDRPLGRPESPPSDTEL